MMKELTADQIITMMNLLRAEGRRFLKAEFDMELEIPIEVNGRLKRALGNFHYKKDRRTGEMSAVKINISKVVLQNGYEMALDVLKHELIHYALLEKGIPNDDRDPEFIQACTSREVALTDTIQAKQKKAIMVCDKCGHEWALLRRRNGCTHRGCGGALVFKGREIR